MTPARYPSLAHRKQAFARGEARDAAVRREVQSWGGTMLEETTGPVVYAENLLPSVEGFVHGLVQVDPVFIVQCDGCGRIAIGETDPRGERTALVILFCGITFGDTDRDPRRLCARCRVDAGWKDFDTEECRTDPKKLAFHEQYMTDRDPVLFTIEGES